MRRHLLAFFVSLIAASAGAADYKIVVNPANPVSSLSRQQIAALFLKTMTDWPHGPRAFPVDQTDASAARDVFSRDIHGKSTSAVKSYWLQVIFSGRGVPPPEKKDDAAVLAYVKEHPGAIGYVSASAPVDALKVLEMAP